MPNQQTHELIGESPTIVEARRMINVIARSDENVLVRGETGTGKEIVAKTIHRMSGRNTCELVIINCPAIAESLAESELFGYTRGSFTGANTNGRQGKLKLADNGTVFFDEIGDMALDVQRKLLRFLNNGPVREIQALGGTVITTVNVRVIAATHQELEDETVFRQDLFERINAFVIALPPLRDRREDIPLLARHFAGPMAIEDGAIDILQLHDWPGNVRQLEKVIRRAELFAGQASRDRITGDDLCAGAHEQKLTVNLRTTPWPHETEGLMTKGLELCVKEFEHAAITEALMKAEGNQSEAARLLKMSRSTLMSKMRVLGMKTRADAAAV